MWFHGSDARFWDFPTRLVILAANKKTCSVSFVFMERFVVGRGPKSNPLLRKSASKDGGRDRTRTYDLAGVIRAF